MRLSQDGRLLLTLLEGRRARIYQDAAGHDTIGVGHLILEHERQGFAGRDLSHGEIETLLSSDLTPFEDAIYDACQDGGLIPTQHQFDAFVLIAFNIGLGGRDPGFLTSTAFRRFLSRDDAGAAAAFLLWNKITITRRKTGNRELVVSRALEARRVAESRVFLHGYYDPTPYNSLDDKDKIRALITPRNADDRPANVIPSTSEVRPTLKTSRTMKAATAGQAGTGLVGAAATVGVAQEITEQARDVAYTASDAARSVSDVADATHNTAAFMSSLSLWIFVAIGVGAVIAITAFILVRKARKDDWQRGLR